MATGHMEVTIPGLPALLARLDDPGTRARIASRVIRNGAIEVNRQAVRGVRSRTGITRAGIHVRFELPWKATIESSSIVGMFLELGTSAHVILPKNAKALMLPVRGASGGGGSPFGRSYGSKLGGRRTRGSRRTHSSGGTSGQVAFFKSVHHPGTKPMPFMQPAFDTSLPYIEELMNLAANEIASALAHGATDL